MKTSLLYCRGDLISTKLLFDCLQQFSRVSRLITNEVKICIYFGGVEADVQHSILEQLGPLWGSLLFKYLGVLLSSKKLTISRCQPLIDKKIGRMTYWTAKFLFYLGRLQLLHKVLHAIKDFWSQIFLLKKRFLNKLRLSVGNSCGLVIYKVRQKI